jgi:predicted DNA-binding protein (MmcQ/YjbR family)
MLDLNQIKDYCAKKSGSREDYPFGPDTLVFKVLSKMYALVGEDENPLRMNLKCDPEQAPVLRSMHDSILPGYHMNKEHWNTIVLDGTLPDELVFKLIDESYDLVAAGLKKSEKEELQLLAKGV